MADIERHHESSLSDDERGPDYSIDDENSLLDREAQRAAIDKEEKIVALTAFGMVGAIFGAVALRNHRKNNKR